MFEVRSRMLGHGVVAQSADFNMALEHANVKRKVTGEHYDIYEVKLAGSTQTVADLIKEVEF